MRHRKYPTFTTDRPGEAWYTLVRNLARPGPPHSRERTDQRADDEEGVLQVTIKVSEETRQRTNKCWRGFACVSDPEGIMCAVRSCVRGVLFVDKQKARYCPYEVTFGYSHICSCPIRQEIYTRYGI
jgi:hypothetical protein